MAEAEEKECIPTTVYMGLAGWMGFSSKQDEWTASASGQKNRTATKRSVAWLEFHRDSNSNTRTRASEGERTAQRTRRPGAAPRARHGIILIGRRWSDSDEGGGGDIAGVHSQRTSSHSASQKQSQDSYVVGPAELSINHFNTIQHKMRGQAIPVVVTTIRNREQASLSQPNPVLCMGPNDHPAGTPYL